VSVNRVRHHGQHPESLSSAPGTERRVCGSVPPEVFFTRVPDGLFAFAFTNAQNFGQVVYVQATFTNAAVGTYFLTSFDNTGTLQDTGIGRFIVK
jgi:hypothetical protein